MSAEELQDPRQIWDRWFAEAGRRGIYRNYEPWLERWISVLGTSGSLPVLDLGCGDGFDSRYLLSKGFQVVVADFSREGLTMARGMAEQANMVQMDLRDGMPFREEAFQAIVANLCLHYFRWLQTQDVVEEIRKRLMPGGYLLARVNSTEDYHHGAVGYEMVERNCYIVRGVLKRFFGREDASGLFAGGWEVKRQEEQVIHCYRKPKAVWEIVAMKV
jgi:SAM-dependent methyltransferase